MQSIISGVARMSKLRGHRHGHAPATKNFKIIHSEIASEAVFGHKYNSLVAS